MDRARVADLLILVAFVAVLTAPLPSVARAVTYLLALLVLCTPSLWHAVRTDRLAACAGMLLAYLVLTSFWSDNPDVLDALRLGIRALVLCAFVVAYADCVRRGDVLPRIGRWFAVVGGIVAAAATARFFLDTPPEGRLHGLGGVHNSLTAAQAYAVVTLVALDTAYRSKPLRWRVLGIASALAAALAVLLCGSRSAWLALPVGLGVLLLAHRGTAPLRFAGATVAGAVAIALLAFALAANEYTRDFLLPRADSFRLGIWEAVLADVARHGPWFGRGILSPDEVSVQDIGFRHAHSMYLSVLYHGGVVAAALLAATLGGTAVVLVRRLGYAEARLAIALLAAGAVFWLVDGRQLVERVGVHWWLFWLPVATAVGLATGKRKLLPPDRQSLDKPAV